METNSRSGLAESRQLRELIVEAADAIDRADRLAAAMRRKGQVVDPADLDAISAELPNAVLHLDALTERLAFEASPPRVPLLPSTAARAIRTARDSFGA